MKLSEMPVVTVEQQRDQLQQRVEQLLEQCLNFEAEAVRTKQQHASLLQEFNNVCNQRDQLEVINAELLDQISNIYDCIFMADDNAAGHGYDADSSVRRHLGYAMTIANKAKAGEKQ
jgi:chromosome segregation ATPase